jgi:hypothetical protein
MAITKFRKIYTLEEIKNLDKDLSGDLSQEAWYSYLLKNNIIKYYTHKDGTKEVILLRDENGGAKFHDMDNLYSQYRRWKEKGEYAKQKQDEYYEKTGAINVEEVDPNQSLHF